jgi:hypothetical protein
MSCVSLRPLLTSALLIAVATTRSNSSSRPRTGSSSSATWKRVAVDDVRVTPVR